MYTLLNGMELIVTTDVIRGMAGEPMEIVTLTTGDGRVHRFDEIKHLMKPLDARDIAEHLDEIQESNHFSAITFCQ